MEPAFLLPLASGFLYPVGSLFLKQAIGEGAGAMRVLFLCNVAIAVFFWALIPFNEEAVDWSRIFWPVITGAAFFFGQLFTVLAIRVGDVSVQAPLMGTKAVFVAASAAAFGAEEVSLTLWIAAGITTVAIFLLGSAQKTMFRDALSCIVFSLAASLCYGLTDTLVAMASPAFGRLPFVVTMTQVVALLSLLLIPFFSQPLWKIPRRAWTPTIAGSAFIGLQAVLLGIALSVFGRPTEMNILYSSRGLWGVVLVWFAGHFFDNRERQIAGIGIMRRRLAGAALLCIAIAVVLV